MTEDNIPIMPHGVRLHFCSVREQWFLLAPERALAMDSVAHAVLSSVNGKSTVAEIAGKLAKMYDAEERQIQGDCLSLLTNLEEQRIIDVTKVGSPSEHADV